MGRSAARPAIMSGIPRSNHRCCQYPAPDVGCGTGTGQLGDGRRGGTGVETTKELIV
jgi:hypothetical protein